MKSSYCRCIYDITGASTLEDRGYSREANHMTSTTPTTRFTSLPGTRRYPVWFARIGGRDAQFGLKREFIKGYDYHDGTGRLVAFDVPLVEGAVYQDHVKDLHVVRDGALVEVSRHNEAEVQALIESIEKPVAEQPAAVDLEAYKAKVERFLRQEGYTTDPRVLIDRYPDTIAIGAAGVGPHDCALQLIDNWEHNVPAEGQEVDGQQDRAPTEAELADVRERYRLASDLMCSTSKALAEASATNDRVLRNSRVPAKRAAASAAMFEAWKASDAAMEAFRSVEDELQQAEGRFIQAKWAEDLRCADKVEHALNELMTWSDVMDFVRQAAANPQGAAHEGLVESLGSDAIVVLGDGSVLSWGQEHVYGGTTYRDLTVYDEVDSRGQNVLIAAVFKDELEKLDEVA